jgi:hypothetical protein
MKALQGRESEQTREGSLLAAHRYHLVYAGSSSFSGTYIRRAFRLPGPEALFRKRRAQAGALKLPSRWEERREESDYIDAAGHD